MAPYSCASRRHLHPCHCLLVMTMPLLTSCGAASIESEELSSNENQPLWHDNRWTMWPSDDVNVCWESGTYGDSAYSAFRANVESWIRESYGRYTALRITGWGVCPAYSYANGAWSGGTGTIRITVNTATLSAGGTSQHSCNGPGGGGYQTCGPTELTMGSDGVNKFPALDNTGNKRVVLHEFGHALGLNHENDSSSNGDPNSCPRQAPGTGTTFGTPFDQWSIMIPGQCVLYYPDTANSDTLSPWDIVGLQNAFGSKANGQIVGMNNLCINMAYANTPHSPVPDTQWLTAYDCVANPNLYWSLYALKGANSAYYGLKARDYAGYAYWDAQTHANGQQLRTNASNDSLDQAFIFSDIKIIGMGNLCLDVPWDDRHEGQNVWLWSSNENSDAQRWTLRQVNGYYQLVSGHSNYCLQAAVPGGSLTLSACSSNSSAQLFSLAYGRIRLANYTNSCIGALPAVPGNGTNVGITSCRTSIPPAGSYDELTRQAAQRWYVTGALRLSSNGKCVDVDNTGGARVGSIIQLWGCSRGANQTWDFHF